jgi:hypothetical protein
MHPNFPEAANFPILRPGVRTTSRSGAMARTDTMALTASQDGKAQTAVGTVAGLTVKRKSSPNSER